MYMYTYVYTLHKVREGEREREGGREREGERGREIERQGDRYRQTDGHVSVRVCAAPRVQSELHKYVRAQDDRA